MSSAEIKAESSVDKVFHVAKLYFDRGDLSLAIPKFKEALDTYYNERKFSEYLECQNRLLRCYAEREQFEEIQAIKERLQDLVLREGFELNAKTYYTLALCTSYRGQHETALEYLQKSLALALATDVKKDICFAISGFVAVYVLLRRYEEALKEIYNLQVFFQVYDMPELRVSAQINNAIILSNLGKLEQARDILWQAYDAVRDQKSLMMLIYVQMNLGIVYAEMGDHEMAKSHLKMAFQICDPKELKYRFSALKNELEKLGDLNQENYDLVFDSENHTVIEKRLGKIDFKNQFILLDLLKLFVQNQGHVYSKEFLVERVWKQNYDPSVHDNKIYVTIKRLRKMIEPDYEKPKYIFRAKNGYFMNKSARVHVDQRGIEK